VNVNASDQASALQFIAAAKRTLGNELSVAEIFSWAQSELCLESADPETVDTLHASPRFLSELLKRLPKELAKLRTLGVTVFDPKAPNCGDILTGRWVKGDNDDRVGWPGGRWVHVTEAGSNKVDFGSDLYEAIQEQVTDDIAQWLISREWEVTGGSCTPHDRYTYVSEVRSAKKIPGRGRYSSFSAAIRYQLALDAATPPEPVPDAEAAKAKIFAVIKAEPQLTRKGFFKSYADPNRHPEMLEPYSIEEFRTAWAWLLLIDRTTSPRADSYTMKHRAEAWGRANGMSPYVSNGMLIAAAIALSVAIKRDPRGGPNATLALSDRSVREVRVQVRKTEAVNGRTGREA
jgi:hypothetical protein